MEFSDFGKKKVASHVALFLFNIVALVLAINVAKFNQFFYVADLFPMAVSIITCVVLFVMLTMEFALARSPLGLPLVESGILGVLSIFWLAFNVFSMTRWKYIPMQCEAISVAFSPERAWCKNVMALRTFVWVVFATCAIITLWTITYTLMKYKQGHKDILKTPLSQYEPEFSTDGLGKDDDGGWYPDNSFAAPAPGGAANNHGFKGDWTAGPGFTFNTNAGASNAYPFASGIGSQDMSRNGGASVTRAPSGSKYVPYEKDNPFERLPPTHTPKTPRKMLEKDSAAAW